MNSSGRMYQDPVNPAGMLNSVKSCEVKKTNNVLRDVPWMWLEVSKRLMNLHFKKPAGGGLQFSLPHIKIGYPLSMMSLLSGEYINMANPRKEMLGMIMSPLVKAAKRNLPLVLVECSRSYWASICCIENIMFNGRYSCILPISIQYHC